jgi:outer membrane protein assembly factor BamB/Tol biopolymer transport system component
MFTLNHRGGRKLALFLLVLGLSFSAMAQDPLNEGAPPQVRSWKINFDPSSSIPVIANGVLYIGSADGAIYAIDPNTGEIKWRFQAGENLPPASTLPTVINRRGLSGIFDVLAAQDAQLAQGRKMILMTPAVKDGTVYVASEDHSFYAIDAATGQKKWSYALGFTAAASTAYKTSAPLLINDGVYFATDQGLYALDAYTGQKKWLFEIPGQRARNSPVLDNGLILLTTMSTRIPMKGLLYAVDPESGKAKWVVSIDNGNDISAPIPAKNVVFFSVGESVIEKGGTVRNTKETLYAVNLNDGQTKWRFDLPPQMASRSMRIAGNLICFGIGGVVLWRPWASAPTAPVVTRFTIALPQVQVLQWGNGGLAISPDGRYVAYSANLAGRNRQLFVRAMDRSEVVAIPGTDNASGLFFSPDSQWLAFTANNQLKKVPVAGGTPIILCNQSAFSTGSWAPDGNIYSFFADTAGTSAGQTSKLMRVPAAGGKCEPVATFDVKAGELGPRWLEALPGGEAILVVNGGTNGLFSDDATILVQSLKTGERKTLIQGGTSPHYLAPGYLVYAQSGRLLAVPFDLRRLQVTGVAVPILEDVGQGTGGYSAYALSANGSLAYMNGGEAGNRPKTTLQWVDRAGAGHLALQGAHVFAFPYLSPDGRHVAIRNGDAAPGWDIWVADVDRGTLTRLTFAKSNEQVASAVWTPDGQRVIYGLYSTAGTNSEGGQSQAVAAGTGAVYKIMWRAADGAGSEEELLSGPDAMWPMSCSPDGQFLVYYENRQGHRDLFLLPLKGERKPRALIENSFSKTGAQISPDGRWLAYASDESGRPEVFVQPFPDLRGRWQISTMGGNEPRWSRDGRQMFYRSGSKIMAVDIESRSAFAAGAPRMLFDQQYSASNFVANYDVASDGRFVMLKDTEEQTTQIELRMVLNWGEEVKRRLPTGLR